MKELSELKDCLAAERGAKERLEGKLNLVNKTNCLMKEEVQKQAQECNYYWNASYKYAEGIRQMLSIVEGLKNTAMFTSEGWF